MLLRQGEKYVQSKDQVDSVELDPMSPKIKPRFLFPFLHFESVRLPITSMSASIKLSFW
jgi:hypothetical protein